MMAERNPGLVRFNSSIGAKTQNGFDQPAVHITAAGNSGCRVFFQCQIHARELFHQLKHLSRYHLKIRVMHLWYGRVLLLA